jgi:hypothetical protein
MDEKDAAIVRRQVAVVLLGVFSLATVCVAFVVVVIHCAATRGCAARPGVWLY